MNREGKKQGFFFSGSDKLRESVRVRVTRPRSVALEKRPDPIRSDP